MPSATPRRRPRAAYPDTSFLFSLVLHDANSAAVVAYLKVHAKPLAFTPWQWCELRHAVRLAVWRGHCDASACKFAIERITTDLGAGNLLETALIWPEVLQLADELGERHTPTLGVRNLDLLHVAAAVSLGARTFLTCDNRQFALAQAAGLHAEKIV